MFTGIQPFDDFVQAIDPDHPLGRYTDVLIKHPLQHSLAEMEAGDNIFNSHAFAVDTNFIHNLAGEHRGFVAFRHALAEKILSGIDPHDAILVAEHRLLELLSARAEDIVERDGAVGQSGERRLQERIKPSRPEFHAEDLAQTFKNVRRPAFYDTVNPRVSFSQPKLNRGMRTALLIVWSDATHVPTHHPKMLDEHTQIG